MANGFLGQIRIMATNDVPTGWLPCNGKYLKITEYSDLYSIIGTTYGSDSGSFALPNMWGRIPVGAGHGIGLTPRTVGTIGGYETASLEPEHLPEHNHSFHTSTMSTSSKNVSEGCSLGVTPTLPNGTVVAYAPYGFVSDDKTVTMASGALSTAPGDSLSHDNMMPYIALNYIICVQGPRADTSTDPGAANWNFEDDDEMGQFIGEIRMLPTNIPLMGWLPCDGRALPTTYEYNPLNNRLVGKFGFDNNNRSFVPNMRCRVPLGASDVSVYVYSNHKTALGNKGGTTNVQLSVTQLPPHTHEIKAASATAVGARNLVANPQTNYLSSVLQPKSGKGVEIFDAFTTANYADCTFNELTVSDFNGTGDMHSNMQPYAAMAFYICWDGYPAI